MSNYGQPGWRAFSKPVDVAVASDGTLYVSDSDLDLVPRLPPAGTWSDVAALPDAEFLALSPDESVLHVAASGLALARVGGLASGGCRLELGASCFAGGQCASGTCDHTCQAPSGEENSTQRARVRRPA